MSPQDIEPKNHPSEEAGATGDAERATAGEAERSTQAGAADSGGGVISPEPESRGEEGRRIWLRRGVLAATLTMMVLLATCTAYELATWPDVEALERRNPETTAFIERYRERAREAGREPRLIWSFVPLERISPHLKRAVLVAEDIEFFSHEGFALGEIREAVREALAGERVRGASTLTQQLAKNLWLSPSRNPIRKLREALLTWQLERELSKRRILELYLNVVEFGPGIYGAEAAAQHYFGKSALELSEWESAQLAAALPRPSQWHPGSGSDRYWWYVSEVQRRMEKAQFLWRYFAPTPVLPRDTGASPADTGLVGDTLTTDTAGPLEAIPGTFPAAADTTAAPPDSLEAPAGTLRAPPEDTLGTPPWDTLTAPPDTTPGITG